MIIGHSTQYRRYLLRFCDICLSVCHRPHIPFVYSVSKRHIKFTFLRIVLLSLVNGEVILRWKGHRSRSLGTKMQNLLRISWQVDRFTWSNPFRNDLRLILHILSDTFRQRKCIVLFDVCQLFVYSYKTKHYFSSNLAYTCILLRDCRKIGVSAETFPLEGGEVFITGLFRSSLNLGCFCRLCWLCRLRYNRYSDYFANKVFRICTVTIQMSPK